MTTAAPRAPLTTWSRDGLRFDVRDTGPVDAEVVVCLHGFPQDGTAYDEVSRLLVADGLRVLVPDQRGCSRRARPPGRDAYALPELVADVVALLDEAGVERAHVVGHDWGGAVAWTLGSRQADRVRSLTVLSTPHPVALRAALFRSSQALRSSYMAFFQLPLLPELLVSGARGLAVRQLLRASGLDEAHAERYATRLQEPGAASATLNWYRAMVFAHGAGPGRVRRPTTYVVGRRDPFFDASAVRATAALVQAPFRQVDLDAGHWLPEQAAAEVAGAVLRQVRAVGR